MLITYTTFSSLHAMTMRPRTGPEGINLHAVVFMLRKVKSTSDVNRGPEPYQLEWYSTHLSQFYALPTLKLSLRSMVQCGRMRMRMTTITLRVQNLSLSSRK